MISNNAKYNRFLNNKPQNKSKDKDKNKLEYKMTETDFPNLVSTVIEKNNYLPYLGNTFANTILTDKIIEEDKIILEPGWISIKYDVFTKTKIYTYGNKTENMIKREQQNVLENDLNYRIDLMIDKIMESRKKNIEYYETIYGDDTYADLYFYSCKDNIDSDEEYDY